MPKHLPNLESMVFTLVSRAVPIKNYLRVANSDPATISTHIENFTSTISNWATRFSVGLIVDGKKILDRKSFPHVLCVNSLDGIEFLPAGIQSAASVFLLMRIDENGMGHPERTVIYNPSTGQIWTAKTEGGVKYKASIYAKPKVQFRFNAKDLVMLDGIRISVTRRDNSDARLNEICGDIGKKFVVFNNGSAALNGGEVAIGNLHGCISTKTTAVEMASVSLMIHELGGIVTDLSGNLIEGFQYYEDDTDPSNLKSEFLLSNGMITARDEFVHEEILAAITTRKPK